MECENGKLFVGGVSRETDENTLRQHFSKYGEVEEALIIVDKTTGCRRGFGFVTFTHPSMAAKALEDQHVILDKKVDVKPAKPKGENYSNQNWVEENDRFAGNIGTHGDYDTLLRTKKIFVGGLPSNLTEEDFKKYFKSYGTITDAVVICDKENHKPRGFGFITFDAEDAVDNVLQNTFHELNGKVVEVKRAEPKDRDTRRNSEYNFNHPPEYMSYVPCDISNPYPFYICNKTGFYCGWNPCFITPPESHQWQPELFSLPTNMNGWNQGVMNGSWVLPRRYPKQRESFPFSVNTNGSQDVNDRSDFESTTDPNSNGSGEIDVPIERNSFQIDDLPSSGENCEKTF